MSLFYHYTADLITIEGQTYRHRDRLKALGARFHGGLKAWQLPNNPNVLDAIKLLCQELGGGAAQPLLLEESEPPRNEEPRELDVSPAPANESGADAGEAPAPQATSLSVSQLMALLNGIILQNIPQAVWVIGEVQGLSVRANVIYFTLAEQDPNQQSNAKATVSALLWRHTAKVLEQRHGSDTLKGILQEGMQVRCLVQVSIYAGRGNVSLSVLDLDPAFTQGALALAREKLLKELRAKGLDRTNKQRYLTPIPLRIGLLSADQSRALGDFLHHLEAGGYPGEIVFVPIPVQGSKVAPLIKLALGQLVTQRCDLIVLTRGGGSAADLQAFDSAEVAYAIAHCPLPVIAAIGHHDDFCVAEEICYQRRKTPTAAADFILEFFSALKIRLSEQGERFSHLADRSLVRQQERLLHLAPRLEKYFLQTLTKVERRCEELLGNLKHRAVQRTYQAEEYLNRTVLRRLDHYIASRMESYARLIEGWTQRLISRDPSPWLQAGWTSLQGPRGRIKRVSDALPGEIVRARVSDGTISLAVQESAATPSRNHDYGNARP